MRSAHIPIALIALITLLTGLLALASVSSAAAAPGVSTALPAANSAPSAAAPSQAADPATLASILGGQAPHPVVSCIACPLGFHCCILGLRPTCYPWNKPCP